MPNIALSWGLPVAPRGFVLVAKDSFEVLMPITDRLGAGFVQERLNTHSSHNMGFDRVKRVTLYGWQGVVVSSRRSEGRSFSGLQGMMENARWYRSRDLQRATLQGPFTRYTERTLLAVEHPVGLAYTAQAVSGSKKVNMWGGGCGEKDVTICVLC